MTGSFIKKSMRFTYDYVITLIIFGVFLYTFMAIAKENYGTWLPLFSFLVFLILALLVYSDAKSLAFKEKRPQYNINPKPYRGFIAGIIGFIPILLLVGIFLFVLYIFKDMIINGFSSSDMGISGEEFVGNIRRIGAHTILSPVFWCIKLFGKTVVAYVLACLATPITAGLGYLAGFYGFDIIKRKNPRKPRKNDRSRE